MWPKKWLTMSKFEMLHRTWCNVQEEIPSCREIGVLGWICHLRSTHRPWEGSEDATFTVTVRNKFVIGGPSYLKRFLIALIWMGVLTVETEVTKLGNLHGIN